MTNQLIDLLDRWRRHRDETEWVLGVVTAVEGSAYRKPGAMMLLGGMGERLGLLSGGCLESDLARQARRVMDDGRPRTLRYDMNEEDSTAWQLGIGCGGAITLRLFPLNEENGHLALEPLRQRLGRGEAALYRIDVENERPAAEVLPLPAEFGKSRRRGRWLEIALRPPPHLLIFGGGIDAVPLVDLAARLGWRTLLCDPRPSHARRADFPSAVWLLHCHPGALEPDLLEAIDAAVVMTHNIALDGEALTALRRSRARYIALLGPRHRRDRVLDEAGLDPATLPAPLAGPAGFDIGGELPESIALSILAQCHAVLEGRPAAIG